MRDACYFSHGIITSICLRLMGFVGFEVNEVFNEEAFTFSKSLSKIKTTFLKEVVYHGLPNFAN